MQEAAEPTKPWWKQIILNTEGQAQKEKGRKINEYFKWGFQIFLCFKAKFVNVVMCLHILFHFIRNRSWIWSWGHPVTKQAFWGFSEGRAHLAAFRSRITLGQIAGADSKRRDKGRNVHAFQCFIIWLLMRTLQVELSERMPQVECMCLMGFFLTTVLDIKNYVQKIATCTVVLNFFRPTCQQLSLVTVDHFPNYSGHQWLWFKKQPHLGLKYLWSGWSWIKF